MRIADGLNLDGIVLDPAADKPLHRQLYEAVRELILDGSLAGGTRIPSSRALSNSLAISRFTVVTALEHLVAEGYLNSILGSGTYVEDIPSLHLNVSPESDESPPQTSKQELDRLSQMARDQLWRDADAPSKPIRYLHMSIPDHRLFPAGVWSKLTREVYETCDIGLASYRVSDAPTALEIQIANQIAVSRGIRCDPENVVVTLGGHHAVTLLIELLLNPGDNAAFEEPGMGAIRSAITSFGCQVLPMQVDHNGPNPASLGKMRTKLAFVTAAKQQPLTIAMPISRKIELLNWATETGALIIEDDLGSEFRYEGAPIPPLKALDEMGQVIYVGAFSMSLLQTLRVGYIIAPRWLAKKARELIKIRYRATPQLTEQVLARFIEDGHYTRHLHKARKVYAGRQDYLLSVIERDFSDTFEMPKNSAGFYSLCRLLNPEINMQELMLEVSKRELGVSDLGPYYANWNAPDKSVLIGFASSTRDEIDEGMRRLRMCI